MQTQRLKQYLRYSLLGASLALSAASARPQGRNYELPIVKGECPHPIALTLTAKNPTSFVAADFAPTQVNAQHMTGLADTSINKNFLYTFQWKREQRCCQITKAVLTVKMKANQGGQSSTSADAGNDGIAIMHLGNVVAPYNEAIYSNAPKPFVVATPVSKSWTLNPAGRPRILS